MIIPYKDFFNFQDKKKKIILRDFLIKSDIITESNFKMHISYMKLCENIINNKLLNKEPLIEQLIFMEETHSG